MPVITSLLIGTALVSTFQWLVWDGREDEAPPGAPPPSPFSSFANLRRHISRTSLREEREEDEEEEDIELPPSPLPDYHRIMERQRSFRVLKERKAREAEKASKNPTNPTSTQLQQQDSLSSNELPHRITNPIIPLFSAKSVPPPTSQRTSNSTSGTRQPSLTLSDASSHSSARPDTRTHRSSSSSYPLTPEHSQVLLPPVPNILPAQTINDAQMFEQEEEEVDVVSSWLGSMEREGERVACGAVNCEANSSSGGGKRGGVCRCFEEGESEIRGRRMSAC